MAALRDVFLTSMLIVLLVGSIAGMIIGVGLVVRADAMFRLFGRLNRWNLTWLDTKAREERPVATHASLGSTQRKMAGTVFILGGGFAAVMLAVTAKVPAILVAKAWGAASIASVLLVEAMRWLLVIGCAFAVFVGILLLFFPNVWNRFEAGANRWKSTQSFFAGADVMHTPLDRWVERSPQTAGTLIAVLSAVSLFAFGALLYLKR